MHASIEYYFLKAILALPEKARMGLFGEKPIKVRESEIDQHTRTLLRLIDIQKRKSMDEIGKESGAPAARAAYQYFYKMGAWPARKAEVTVEDLMLPGGDADIKGRLYKPAEPQNDGMLVYIHGGGGVIGDIEAYDYFNRYMADYLGSQVLFPEYGLGPEDPYPAGVEDCLAVTRALPQLSEKFGFNRQNVVIGGDSAGGMLSTICGHEAAQEDTDVKALWLLFAAFDLKNDTYQSMTDYESGYGLSRTMMDWFADNYFANGGDRSEPYASPLNLPHLQRLPRTLIRAAEYDPLFDQSTVFLEKVKSLGVDVDYKVAKGLLHGYTNLYAFIPAAKAALEEDLDWIKAVLNS